MSGASSPSARRRYGTSSVCRLWNIPRSTPPTTELRWVWNGHPGLFPGRPRRHTLGVRETEAGSKSPQPR